MQIVIDIPDYDYRRIKEYYEKNDIVEATYSYIYHGTPLPKGHGDLIDRGELKTKFIGTEQGTDLEVYLEPTIINAPTIIEADKEYEAEVITRGKCMMCGKELTEGLFFCKECRDKANSGK